MDVDQVEVSRIALRLIRDAAASVRCMAEQACKDIPGIPVDSFNRISWPST